MDEVVKLRGRVNDAILLALQALIGYDIRLPPGGPYAFRHIYDTKKKLTIRGTAISADLIPGQRSNSSYDGTLQIQQRMSIVVALAGLLVESSHQRPLLTVNEDRRPRPLFVFIFGLEVVRTVI